jgi:hypothetical protein
MTAMTVVTARIISMTTAVTTTNIGQAYYPVVDHSAGVSPHLTAIGGEPRYDSAQNDISVIPTGCGPRGSNYRINWNTPPGGITRGFHF